MTTQIDFSTLPANVPVLCIPRVFANINEPRIRRIFDDLNMGLIDRIDIVTKKHGDKFTRVFVHFKHWNDSENARIARERLLNGKEIKVIYDDPWFWKISAYREPERKPVTKNMVHRKATLQLEYDDERRPPVPECFKIDETGERIMHGLNNALSSRRGHSEERHREYRRPPYVKRENGPPHMKRHPEEGIIKKKLYTEDGRVRFLVVRDVKPNVKPDEK